MKKILIVAALVAATAVPAAPSFAADTKMDSKMSPACFFLPLLPDCLSAWKDAGKDWGKDWGKDMKMAAIAPPKMMAIPTCTPAKAGAGYLFVCK